MEKYCQANRIETIINGLSEEMKEDNRSRTYAVISNKNPHWTCICGMKNHHNRLACLQCGVVQ